MILEPQAKSTHVFFKIRLGPQGPFTIFLVYFFLRPTVEIPGPAVRLEDSRQSPLFLNISEFDFFYKTFILSFNFKEKGVTA